MPLLDDSPIELACPNCGHKFTKRLGKLKTNPTLACGKCGASIQIDARQLNATVKKVEKSLADLHRAAGSIGKKR